MCTSTPKAPKAAPPQEPLKNIDATMSQASSDAAIAQARKRGMASVWTRYNAGTTQAQPNNSLAGKATTLGG